MPFAAVVALTDAVTRSVRVKMLVCVGTTATAQALLVLGGVGYLLRIDWRQMAKLVQQRAHADRDRQTAPSADAQPAPPCPALSDGAEQPEPAHAQPLLINAAADSSTRTA